MTTISTHFEYAQISPILVKLTSLALQMDLLHGMQEVSGSIPLSSTNFQSPFQYVLEASKQFS
ncbi:MAG: hypothetical protein ACR2O3_14065, partial [Rhizobiaceae bacterium]